MTTTITKPSRLIPAVLLWALTLLLGGCFTLSVNPLYENADLVSHLKKILSRIAPGEATPTP